MVARKKTEEEVEEVTPASKREEKLKKITALRESLVDKETKEPIMRSLTECDRGVKVLSTRAPSLDIATGVGGIPVGRVTEFYGPERGGKTTLAMQIAASNQENGGITLYLDSEHSLDLEYCKNIGLDVNDPGLLIVQEETADVALTTALRALDEGAVDLIVVDSIANLMPQYVDEKLLEEGVGKAFVGNKARLLTQFFESAIGRVHRGEVAMFCTQQMRTVMKPGMPPRETSASPNSVKHNTSLRGKVSRKKDNEGEGKKTDETYQGKSQETIVRIEKNKVGPPFRQALYTIEYGKGVLYWEDLIESCVVHGVKNVVQGGKYTIVDDNGEIVGKFWKKDIDSFFLDPDNREIGIMLVDKLSDAVGIHLWDPIRGTENRRIGPYTPEEVEAAGGTLIDGVDFKESVPEEDVVVL